jgi:hypothetical protein
MNLDRIARALKTCFNSEDGLSIDVSKCLYAQMIARSPAFSGFKEELESALADPAVSWRTLLACDDYEVQTVETEEEARVIARDLLLGPLNT